MRGISFQLFLTLIGLLNQLGLLSLILFLRYLIIDILPMNKINPAHYDLHLTPNLDNFTFDGVAKIKLHKLEDIDEIDKINLDALELDINSITLEIDGETHTIEYELSMEEQSLKLDVADIELPDEFLVEINYSGEINDKMAGFYRSKFEVDGEEHYCAVTQFQESDARRAFPCFDTPGKKATFDIEFVVDEEYYTISNTSIEEEKKLEGGKKRVKFERTPKMSTYLVFFGVGEFEFIEDEYRDIPVKLLASPGKAEEYGQLGLEYGIKSLKYCEDYYQIEYPLSKMDLIATPDFAAGAMENWGAILFREDALLFFPNVTSKSGKIRIKNVIAHEVAHQWFGNLVSPSKWKYVWLNESFATFFAYKTVDHYEPKLGVWDFFVNGQTNVALVADGYEETVPIEQEDGRAAYTVKTTPILYNKGGSVLRQVEAYLGDDDFQKGLQKYLTDYEYDVAASDHLWKALEEASGKPVSKLMESWVNQMGYPIITVNREDQTITVEQSRFTYLNKDYDTTWLVPITMKQYYEDEQSKESVHLLEDESTEIELDPEAKAFKINVDHTGFYRVYYTDEMYDQLAEMIQNKELSPIDRWNIENDLYAFLLSGKINLDKYLSLLKNFEQEDDHLPLRSISNHLKNLYNILDGKAKEKVAVEGKTILEPILDRIGYLPQDDEDHTISMIRGGLIRNASAFGSDQATEYAMEQFNKLKEGKELDPDLYPTILRIAAKETNDFDWFREEFKSAQTEVEKKYYANAMADFTTESNIEKMETFIFEEVPARNRGQVIQTLTNNDKAKDRIWEWYMANLDNFEKLHPFIYQRALTAVIVASIDYKDEVVEFFEEYTNKNPRVQDPADKGLETMEIHAQLKAHIEI